MRDQKSAPEPTHASSGAKPAEAGRRETGPWECTALAVCLRRCMDAVAAERLRQAMELKTGKW